MPGRITDLTLAKRVSYISKVAGGWPAEFGLTVIPLTSVSESQAALENIDLDALLTYANNHRWIENPPAGGFESADDLAGLLLAGTPDDLVPALRRYAAVGVTDVVFDFRQSVGRYVEQVELIGRHVLPAVADLRRSPLEASA